MRRQRHNIDWAFLAGFTGGVAIGAALGVVYAPRAGRESRRRVMDAARQLPNSVATQYGRAASGIQTGMERAQAAVTARADALSNAFQETKARVSNAIELGAEEARAYIRASDAAEGRDLEAADRLASDVKSRS